MQGHSCGFGTDVSCKSTEVNRKVFAGEQHNTRCLHRSHRLVARSMSSKCAAVTVISVVLQRIC
jgi:hypothetical protein